MPSSTDMKLFLRHVLNLFRIVSVSEQIELTMAQQQQSILTEQKELLKEKLDTMSDYTSLKSERVELQGQLRLLGKQLQEALEENRHLHSGKTHLPGVCPHISRHDIITNTKPQSPPQL